MKEIAKTRKPRTASKFKRPYVSPSGTKVMLTDQQHNFATAALTLKDSNVLIERVMELYECNRGTARVIARQNFQKPNIMEYLGDRGYKALDVLYEAATDKNVPWSERIRAADSIADRQFGRAIQRQEIHSEGVMLSVDLTQSLASDDTK